jgi:acid phosphatase family membrane protein YuiD
MNFLLALIQNPLFVSGFMGWFVAQFIKTILYLIMNKKLVLERMFGNGGMPSSHAATVCGLLTAVGIIYGATGFEFSMALAFAIIVIHDAIGVRRETETQSRIINEMMAVLDKMGGSLSAEEKLKEFFGHTPFQVLIGAGLGIVTGFAVCFFMLG